MVKHPDCCYNCEHHGIKFDTFACLITGKETFWPIRYEKPNWCPLTFTGKMINAIEKEEKAIKKD